MPLHIDCLGEVPEWPNGAVSKTVVPKGTQGSNPCLSAIKLCSAKLKSEVRKYRNAKVPLELSPIDFFEI